jgi:hypothetical protein
MDIVDRNGCRSGSARPYRSGRSRDSLKFKKPAAPAMKHESEEE